MGRLARGKLKSRRGWPSSPRRLLHRSNFLDPGFKNSLQENLYQLCGAGDILIAIDSRRLGPSWSAKMAHSFTAADKNCATFAFPLYRDGKTARLLLSRYIGT